MKFWRDNASYPYQSHELWFLTENVRWGKFTGKEDFKALISKVNREDLWRAAAKELKVPAAQIPDDDVAWRRKILRWQSVRSGEPGARTWRASRSSGPSDADAAAPARAARARRAAWRASCCRRW